MATRGLAAASVAALALLSAPAGAGASAAAPPRFDGATLTSPASPPDFSLRDQHGTLVHLAALRGRVVLLTFLYTHCPDVCPLTATNLNTALTLLGPARRNVVVLAVSVDPRGDTPAAVARFVRLHGLRSQFHYLTGSRAALAGVWRAYQVKAVDRGAKGVDHTLYTLLIDRSGKGRVLFDAAAAPRAIAHDAGLLLG